MVGVSLPQRLGFSCAPTGITGTPPHFPTSYRFAFCMPNEPFWSSPPDMPECLAWASRRTWHAHAWFNIFHRYKLTRKASRSAIVSERCVSTPCITEIGGNGRSWWRARPSRALDKHGERASVEFKRCAPIPPFVSGQTALPLARTTPAPARARMQRVVQRAAHACPTGSSAWHMLDICIIYY